MDQPHRSASRNARNFRSVSSTSASGRLPATIPAPAYSVAWSPRSSAHLSAIAHSPSPLASTHPTGPAYDPSIERLELGDQPQRRITRFPRDGRCRMEGLDELEHARRWVSEEPPELRRQVPHVRRLQQGRDGIPRELPTEGGELARRGHRRRSRAPRDPSPTRGVERRSRDPHRGRPTAPRNRRGGSNARRGRSGTRATPGTRRRGSRSSAPRTCTRPGSLPGAGARDGGDRVVCRRPPRSSERARPCAARRYGSDPPPRRPRDHSRRRSASREAAAR